MCLQQHSGNLLGPIRSYAACASACMCYVSTEGLKAHEKIVREIKTTRDPCAGRSTGNASGSPAAQPRRLTGTRAGSVHHEARSTNLRDCKHKRRWASPGCPVHAERQPVCKKLPS